MRDVATSRTIPSPEYVELDVRLTRGVDLLGLRYCAQVIGESLLNGITTITPLIRYLSFRTWLIDCYIRAVPPPPDRWRTFVEYAQRAEAVFALANLVQDRSTRSLVGSEEALRRLNVGQGPYALGAFTQQAAVNAYARASDQLRLTRGEGNRGMPALGIEYGVPLVQAVEAAFASTRIGQRIRAMEPLETVTEDELKEFGAVAWVKSIPDAERDALLAALLPERPETTDLSRMATYAALLSLAGEMEEGSGRLQEMRLFAEAVAVERTTPEILHDVLDRWALYTVRDAIAVTAEYALAAIVGTLDRLDEEGIGVRDDLVVRRLLEESGDDQIGALRELGLGNPNDDIATLRLATLADRVAQATYEKRTVSRTGVQRWAGELTEVTVLNATPGLRRGCLVAGLVAWLLAEIRVGDAVRRGVPEVAPLSHEGATRFGLEQVVLPRLNEWRARDLTVAEVLAEYAHLVIDQHLRIVWARLSQTPQRDVSVLLRDGDRIVRRSHFDPGRTASRVPEAIGWLQQLGLLREGVLTPFGGDVLDRTLQSLSRALR